MATPAYTVRLFDAEHQAAGWTTAWVVPDTYRWVLRSLIVVSVHTEPQNVFLSFNTGQPPHQIYLYARTMQPYQTDVIDVRQELLVGEVISMYTELGRATMLATGYRFQT